MGDKTKYDDLQQTQQQPQCPEGCCQGDEILCISIPCPITIVLLGLELQLELPCIRLTSPDNLTPTQAQQILASLTNLLGNLVTNTTSE
ncbi:hypothetical protein H839_09353 [Parageobacillus genomosp. 1]|uniref:Spore coat protein n=1 Tax=Parageobacillus genomosp. 1 TaxID=1295642 RepID=A0ABC9VEN0_9BACL|nr:hypothetical protein [Parageobacillus genomosp. 1]EZP76791.1 hypothetical protein H839_09353 [Parageobacillus genomosp. 1]